MDKTDRRGFGVLLFMAIFVAGAERGVAQGPMRVVPPPAAVAVQVGTAVPPEDDIDEDEPEMPPPQQLQMRRLVLNDAMIGQMVFGNARSVTGGESELDSRLKLKICEIENACPLSQAQKAKLQLAGQGEIKHFVERFEAARREWAAHQDDRQRVLQEIQPFRTEFQTGLFGERSFFDKALAKTLGEEQAAGYRSLLNDRRRVQYRARVDLAVLMVGQAAGLDADQRAKLRELLQKETRPPRTFGPYDQQAIFCQAAKLPEGKLRSCFTAAQWRTVSSQFQNALGLEAFLKSNGYLPDDSQDEPAPTPRKPDPEANPLQVGRGAHGR